MYNVILELSDDVGVITGIERKLMGSYHETGFITFLPDGRTVETVCGSTLLDAALDFGIDLPHECGGNCACTSCHVRVMKGREHLSAPEETEQDRLATAQEPTSLSRLGCQALLLGGPIVVEIVEGGAIR